MGHITEREKEIYEYSRNNTYEETAEEYDVSESRVGQVVITVHEKMDNIVDTWSWYIDVHGENNKYGGNEF